MGTGEITGSGPAPTVTFVAPLPNGIDVPTNTKLITFAFTNAMDPATLTAATFTLACPAGTAQAGAVSYVAAGSIATLTLAGNLPANTTCTATISTGAKDAIGIPLASPFTWTFTTGAAPDTTAPTVTGTVNANGATNVATNTKLAFTFSEAMDPSSVNATTFNVKQGATAVAGTVSYAGVTATFAPAGTLAANTVYTVTATTGVKDLAGNPMASNFAVTWTTAAVADTTPPTVTGTTHTNGQINVAINTKSTVTFSEAMDPLTINNVNVKLQETVGSAVVPATLSYAGVTATIVPLSNLKPNTGYTVTAMGGAGGVTDLAGNVMSNTFQVGWTTGAAPDTTAPTVIGNLHNNGQINVPINTKVEATFSEGMNPLTITNVNFTLKTDAGAVVPGTVSYSGVTALFAPLTNLASGTHYNVAIKGGAGGVTDLAGNPMASDFTLGWTTAPVADVTAPIVTLVSPADLETGVAVNKSPSVTFSEPMDPLTVTTATFTLAGPGTTPVAGTVLNDNALPSAVFTPLTNLASNTIYTATIKGGAGGAKDVAGNALAVDKVWSFTTAAVIIPPPPPPSGPAPINLGSILTNNFVALTTTGITNTGSHLSKITGNIGASPITAAAMNGLWCSEITGKIYAGDAAYTGNGVTTCFAGNPGVPAVVPADANKTLVDNARGDMLIAYGDAAGRTRGVGATNLNLGGGTLAGINFAPGTYTWTTDVVVTADITLTGTANDTWLFQIDGDLAVMNGVKVTLAGGALAKNVFWQVKASNFGVTLNTGSTMNGVVLSGKQIIFRTGTTLNGRSLSETQTVLDQTTIGP